jgi:hypothetical protein
MYDITPVLRLSEGMDQKCIEIFINILSIEMCINQRLIIERYN